MRRYLVIAAALLGATGTSAQSPAPARQAPPGPYQAPVELPHLQDGAISESSGVAASRRNPGLLWTHNDSGDKPYLYAVDQQGVTAAVFQVRGAKAADWEDMAYGPGPDGKGSYLYVGDIGDNERRRTDCVVYRVPEPKVEARAGAASSPQSPPPQPTADPTVARAFTYPDGAHDAEALLVHPTTGVVYVVTKEANGVAGVYKFPPEPPNGGQKNKLIKVGTVTISGEAPPFPNQVTGGDISPDGRKAVLCTYNAAYEFSLPAGASGFDAIWATRPVRVQTPALPQGEAICYTPDGKSLLVTSEKAPALVYRLDRR